MKIFVFEPYGVRSGTGNNDSERFKTIMEKLALHSPIELRLNDISSPALKTSWLLANDNQETIIIAHYSDVEDHFNELESVNSAICLYHTYKTSWYKEIIDTDTDVIRIVNGVNRFCIDSETLKGKVDTFVQDVVNGKNAKLVFDSLMEYDPELEKLFEPFISLSPFSKLSDIATDKDKKPIKDKEGKNITIEKAKEYLSSHVKSKLKS